MDQYLGARWWRLGTPTWLNVSRKRGERVNLPRSPEDLNVIVPSDLTDVRLYSVVMPYAWDGPMIRSQHITSVSSAFDNCQASLEYCVCGIYACNFGLDVQTYNPPITRVYSFVFGEIELYGRIIVGSLGYRATHGIIRSLVVQQVYSEVYRVWREGDDLAPYLEQRYQCPVTVVEDLNGYWRDYRDSRSAA